MSDTLPLVSVIIPAYLSHETLAGCLRTMCSQTFRDVEVLVVDSSPDDRCERIVRDGFPTVHYRHSAHRLLPYAARTQGIGAARGSLLGFTDPDVYAPPRWIETLVAAYHARGGVVAGAISCFGKHWVDQGNHFCKFDKWLPSATVRQIDIASTANMLCDRASFETAGGFVEDTMLGDTLISWAFSRASIPIWFVPAAAVEHHHLSTWGGLLRERYARGREFAALRVREGAWSKRRMGAHLLLTLLPVRFIRLIGRVCVNAQRAGLLGEFSYTLPLILSGEAAWLLGEAAVYVRRLAVDDAAR
jgi:GT2 family glycosyltransferase